MNQDFISQTPLDQMVTTDYGQMLKASVPYLPPRSRQILSIYEKARELINTVSLFENFEENSRNGELSAMSVPSRDPMDMLNEIREFCYGPSRERLDQIVNMMVMVQMLKIMNQPDSCPGNEKKEGFHE